MKHYLFFLPLSIAAFGSFAQTAVGRDSSAEHAAPEQRRAELRMALRTTRDRDAKSNENKPENVPANRHLTDQERLDLRQQLRSQRHDGKQEF